MVTEILTIGTRAPCYVSMVLLAMGMLCFVLATARFSLAG
jgi:hypothetical protein